MEFNRVLGREIPNWEKELVVEEFQVEEKSNRKWFLDDNSEYLCMVWRAKCLAFPDHATADGVYLAKFGHSVPLEYCSTERIERLYDQCSETLEIKELGPINFLDTCFKECRSP